MFKKTTLFVALFAIIAASLLTLAPQPANALSSRTKSWGKTSVFSINAAKEIVEVVFKDGLDTSDKTIKTRFHLKLKRVKGTTDMNKEGRDNGEEWKITELKIEDSGAKFDMNTYYKTPEEKEAFLKTFTGWMDGYFMKKALSFSGFTVGEKGIIAAAPEVDGDNKVMAWEPIEGKSTWKRIDSYTNKDLAEKIAKTNYNTDTKTLKIGEDDTTIVIGAQNKLLGLVAIDYADINVFSDEDKILTNIDQKFFTTQLDGTRLGFSCTDTSKVPATVTCAITAIGCDPSAVGGGIAGAIKGGTPSPTSKIKVAECKSNEKCEAGKGCVAIPGTGTPAPAPLGNGITQDPSKVTKSVGKVTNPLNTTSPQQLIVRIINYLIGLAGAIAVLMIVVGGYQYITSAGNAENSKKAVTTIRNAIIGLIVVVLSYIIVRSVADVLTGTREKATKVTSTVQTVSPTGSTTPSSTGGTTGLTPTQKQAYDAQCLKDCKAKDTKKATCTEVACESLSSCAWQDASGLGVGSGAGTCVSERTTTAPEPTKSADEKTASPDVAVKPSSTSPLGDKSTAAKTTKAQCEETCLTMGSATVGSCTKDICGAINGCDYNTVNKSCDVTSALCQSECNAQGFISMGSCSEKVCTAISKYKCGWDASTSTCGKE